MGALERGDLRPEGSQYKGLYRTGERNWVQVRCILVFEMV